MVSFHQIGRRKQPGNFPPQPPRGVSQGTRLNAEVATSSRKFAHERTLNKEAMGQPLPFNDFQCILGRRRNKKTPGVSLFTPGLYGVYMVAFLESKSRSKDLTNDAGHGIICIVLGGGVRTRWQRKLHSAGSTPVVPVSSKNPRQERAWSHPVVCSVRGILDQAIWPLSRWLFLFPSH
jgi:hypothetical protein